MTDFNLSHALMLAKLRVEPGLQRLSIHVSALGQRYERFGHFAMIAVGYANHQRFADGWMVIENFLDLAREYLEPANSNHEIGRALCREGVCKYGETWVVSVSFN